MLPQPGLHPYLRRVSRLVILPDYQGIGLGTKFLTFIAQYWNGKGYDLCIDTSAKNLIGALRRKPEWRMYAYMKTKGSQFGGKWKPRRAYTGRFMYRRGLK